VYISESSADCVLGIGHSQYLVEPAIHHTHNLYEKLEFDHSDPLFSQLVDETFVLNYVIPNVIHYIYF
jgi:hypothetical protein